MHSRCVSSRLRVPTMARALLRVSPAAVSSSDLRTFHSFFSREVGIPFPRLTAENGGGIGGCARIMVSSSSEQQRRGYRSVRRRASLRKAGSKEKELELNVSICIEEDLPDDPEILSIAELLRLNVPMAMKLAFEGLKDSAYKPRDTAIDGVGGFQSVELSVLLCNDNFIRKLNKEWRDEDHATDVLSVSRHVAELNLPILMLGDIVISIETAQRQVEERGHTLLDEVRILMVHGLLHLLGFDHELSEEGEAEM